MRAVLLTDTGGAGGRHTVHGVTAYNSQGPYIRLQSGTDNTTLSNMAVYKGDWSTACLDVANVSNIGVTDLFCDPATAVAQDKITISNTTTMTFSGLLEVNNLKCSVTGGSGVELDGTCNYGSGLAAPTSGVDYSGSYSGDVTTTDSTNGNNTNGTELFANITNWIDFNATKWFRMWTRDGTFTRCGSGNTCRIIDLRLNTGDTALKEKFGAFTNGAACPASVDASNASNVIIDKQSTPNTYLRSAFEIVGDWVGDEDGLCESNEACVYMPNAGAYQGEGDFWDQTCTYTGGNGVTGVTMYAYPTNGI